MAEAAPVMSQDVPPPESKPKRLHSLDYMRCIFVTAALYLHVYQIFSGNRTAVAVDNAMFEQYEPSSPYYQLLNQNLEGWRNDYAQRIQMFGRQLTIPLIFWVSGLALGLGKEKASSMAKKILIITIVGMALNAVVYFIGPMDERCDWSKGGLPSGRYYDLCTGKGLLISFGIGMGAGPAFQILFQFWFTVFLLVFVLQAHPLVEALRELHKASVGEELNRRSVVVGMAVYWVITGGFYILLTSFWNPTDGRKAAGLQMAILEPLFIASLGASAYLPSSHGRTVRFCQYLAALSIIISFCIPDIGSGGGMDGALVTYYHIFKQFFLLGFTMSLTRKKSRPVVSNAYPIALAFLVVTYPPTNYYRSGVDTYPRFPFALDRALLTGGALTWAFCYDRVGTWVADNGSLRPLFPGWNYGALAAFVLQQPLMALLAPLLQTYPNVDSIVWTLIMFFLCALPLGLLEMRSARKKAARAENA